MKLYHFDQADRYAIGIVLVWAIVVSLAVIGVALLAGLALRIFQIVSGL